MNKLRPSRATLKFKHHTLGKFSKIIALKIISHITIRIDWLYTKLQFTSKEIKLKITHLNAMATRLVKSSPPCKLQSVLENKNKINNGLCGEGAQWRSWSRREGRCSWTAARKSQTNYTVIKTKQSCFPNKDQSQLSIWKQRCASRAPSATRLRASRTHVSIHYCHCPASVLRMAHRQLAWSRAHTKIKQQGVTTQRGPGCRHWLCCRPVCRWRPCCWHRSRVVLPNQEGLNKTATPLDPQRYPAAAVKRALLLDLSVFLIKVVRKWNLSKEHWQMFCGVNL